jgi:hypothetical protein
MALVRAGVEDGRTATNKSAARGGEIRRRKTRSSCVARYLPIEVATDFPILPGDKHAPVHHRRRSDLVAGGHAGDRASRAHDRARRDDPRRQRDRQDHANPGHRDDPRGRRDSGRDRRAGARRQRPANGAGVQPRDIATSNVSLQPQYRYENNQPPVITGYQASNTVSIRFRDIAKSGVILDILVKQGANQIDGPSLSLDQPDAALDEARVDAVKRARARAELYAKAAGLSVVRILSISEGGEMAGPQPPIVYMARAKMQDASATSISAGETDVTASVSVRFLLK